MKTHNVTDKQKELTLGEILGAALKEKEQEAMNKVEYYVDLVLYTDEKIRSIKIIRDIFKLGLRDAKETFERFQPARKWDHTDDVYKETLVGEVHRLLVTEAQAQRAALAVFTTNDDNWRICHIERADPRQCVADITSLS